MSRLTGRLPEAAPWAVMAAAAVAAWFLPTKRGTALLNLAAIFAALYLGLRAYKISLLQAKQAIKTTVISRQPLLTVIHEPIGWSGESIKDPWFPAEEPFLVVDEPQNPIMQPPAARAFSVLVEMTRTDERVERALVYLRNVGEGPAMIRTAELRSGLGLVGNLLGNTSLGSGCVEAYSCELRHDRVDADTIAEIADQWAGDWDEAYTLAANWRSRDAERLYFLEIHYDDIFGASENPRTLRAWFDSSERGQWRTRSLLAYPQHDLQIERIYRSAALAD